MYKKNRAEWRKGTLALVVITAVMSAGLLGGCGDRSVYAMAPTTLTVNGTEVEVPYIAIINGKKVSLDEYRYYFLSAKYVMDNGDDSYWAADELGSKQNSLKAQALYAMKETYAVEALAKELKLSLTKDELSQIDADVKNQVSALGGMEEYAQALRDNYLTDELYRFLWKTNFYCEKLWAYYFSSDGPYFIDNQSDELTVEELDIQYTVKFKAIIAEAADKLETELAPEYDLVTVESLQ